MKPRQQQREWRQLSNHFEARIFSQALSMIIPVLLAYSIGQK